MACPGLIPANLPSIFLKVPAPFQFPQMTFSDGGSGKCMVVISANINKLGYLASTFRVECQLINTTGLSSAECCKVTDILNSSQ